MRRSIALFGLVILGILILCAVWSMARANPEQTNSHGSPAQSQVYGDQSSSAAAKGGNARVGNVTATSAPATATANPVANGGKGGKGGKGGNGGSVTNTINSNGNGGYNGPSNPRLAASAIAPPIISGGCAGFGASAALQLPGIGIGGGAVKVDRVCQLHMIGEDAAAKELLCQQDDIRKAFLASGEPCAADLKPYVEPVSVPVDSSTVYPYDYCQTRHAGDKNQHRECDHKFN